jgi:hypothetical protein
VKRGGGGGSRIDQHDELPFTAPPFPIRFYFRSTHPSQLFQTAFLEALDLQEFSRVFQEEKKTLDDVQKMSSSDLTVGVPLFQIASERSKSRSHGLIASRRFS